MKAEVDIYNNDGEHVTASLQFETDNEAFVSSVVKDLYASVRVRSSQWADAQMASLILGDDEPLPGEEVEDGTEDEDIHEME